MVATIPRLPSVEGYLWLTLKAIPGCLLSWPELDLRGHNAGTTPREDLACLSWSSMARTFLGGRRLLGGLLSLSAEVRWHLLVDFSHTRVNYAMHRAST
jgi:hypothetical protein